MKNSYCKLSNEQIKKLPERFLGFMLSPFQYNLRNEMVFVPEDTLQEMIDIIAEYALQVAAATPPSPSTAPEVPPHPEALTLGDVPYAMNTPDAWDPDYRRMWQQLQVAHATIRELRAYARQLRALASRPAEVDDEAVSILRTILTGDVGRQTLGKLARGQSTETEDGKAWLAAQRLVEQYRQGQRDAVAADRARRGAASK